MGTSIDSPGAGALLLAGLLSCCGTVALGDNPTPSQRRLDLGYFACCVQPFVLTARGCTGTTTDSGCPGATEANCHMNNASLRLVNAPALPAGCCTPDPTVAACSGAVMARPYLGASCTLPPELDENYRQAALFADLLAAHATGQRNHPCAVFGSAAPEATLLNAWINPAP